MASIDVLNLEDMAKLAALALRDAAEGRKSLSDEDLRTMLRNGLLGLTGGEDLAADSLDDIFNAALSTSLPSASAEYNHHHLARWFEIHPDDFAETQIESLRPDVLLRHIYYERLLDGWFKAWGYDIEIGEVLRGIEGTEFIPDLHARLDTLHGTFDVAVCLFCASPASTTGVLAKLENIEAYAVEGSHFSDGDLFILATPHDFREHATNQIRLQTRQERYSVVPLEGNDLESLGRVSDPIGRREQLREIIVDWLARADVAPNERT